MVVLFLFEGFGTGLELLLQNGFQSLTRTLGLSPGLLFALHPDGFEFAAAVMVLALQGIFLLIELRLRRLPDAFELLRLAQPFGPQIRELAILLFDNFGDRRLEVGSGFFHQRLNFLMRLGFEGDFFLEGTLDFFLAVFEEGSYPLKLLLPRFIRGAPFIQRPFEGFKLFLPLLLFLKGYFIAQLLCEGVIELALCFLRIFPLRLEFSDAHLQFCGALSPDAFATGRFLEFSLKVDLDILKTADAFDGSAQTKSRGFQILYFLAGG